MWGSGNDLKVKLDLNRTLGLLDALITSPEIPDDFFKIHLTDSFTQAFLQLCQDCKERKRKRKKRDLDSGHCSSLWKRFKEVGGADCRSV